MILFLLLGFVLSQGRASMSFTATGNWSKSQNPDLECSQLHLCTPGNLTFHQDGQQQQDSSSQLWYDDKTSCALLEREKIKKIYLSGDSYMRHIFQALMITFTGDYEHGSVPDFIKKDKKFNKVHCAYGKQFMHKNCSDEDVFRPVSVCPNNAGGAGVIVAPYKEFYYSMENMDHCKDEGPGTITLLSEGNHPIGRSRNTVNNYITYQDRYKDTVCREHKAMSPHIDGPGEKGSFAQTCSLWWVSTHYRMKAYFPAEWPDRVLEFNQYMRMFFEHGEECGNVNYVDVYNMTERLAHTNGGKEATKASYDQVHWNMEINLMKAQLLLRAWDKAGTATSVQNGTLNVTDE
jgi:hypothetical protein